MLSETVTVANQDLTLTDKVAGVEIEGTDYDGPFISLSFLFRCREQMLNIKLND